MGFEWCWSEMSEGGKPVPECEGVVGLEMASGCCASSGMGTALAASEKDLRRGRRGAEVVTCR